MSTLCSPGSPKEGHGNKSGPQQCRSAMPPLVFSGVPKQGDKVQSGPQVGRSATASLCSWGSPAEGDGNKNGPPKGGSATSRLRSRVSPNKGTKSKMAHKWAEVIHHRGVLRGPLRNEDGNEKRPEKRGSGTSPLRSQGFPKKGTTSGVAQKWAKKLRHPCILGAPQTRGQDQRWPINGRKCYVTPAFSRVPKQGNQVKGRPQKGRSAMSTLCSPGSPKEGHGNKSGPQQGRSAMPPLVFSGVPKQGDKVQSGPQVGRSATASLCSWGSPAEGDGNKSGPQKGGSATSRLRSRVSPNKGTKSKMACKWAEVIHHRGVLRGPLRNEYGNKKRPQKHGSGTSPLRSQGFPNKGTTSRVAQKWAKKRRLPLRSRGSSSEGNENKRGPQKGGATSPLPSRTSPKEGTKPTVAHKWAKVLHHIGVLGVPQTTGQSQRWPTKGRKSCITTVFSGSPMKGDGNKSGPQKDHPCVLKGPQTRRQN